MANNNYYSRARYRRAANTLHRQKGILGGLFKGGSLTIEIKDQSFSFGDVESFKSFLAGKTEIPTSKMQEMLKRSDENLQEEIKQLSQVEQTINEKLAATIRDPKSIDTYLDGATMVRFSQDYDWRQIMFELSKQSTVYSEFKLEAVTYYIKYLRSRMSIAHSILKDKSTSQAVVAEKDLMAETMETRALNIEDIQAAQEAEGLISNDRKEDSTAIAKPTEKQETQPTPHVLKKIPRGQTVIIDASSISMLPLKIASRKFIIEMSDTPKLIGKNGDIYPLKPGENLIGRSTKCSIILNPEFVDISRQHLIIELYPNKDLHFTDLSTSGSQVPADLIKAGHNAS